jgi:hypothetical protein
MQSQIEPIIESFREKTLLKLKNTIQKKFKNLGNLPEEKQTVIDDFLQFDIKQYNIYELVSICQKVLTVLEKQPEYDIGVIFVLQNSINAIDNAWIHVEQDIHNEKIAQEEEYSSYDVELFDFKASTKKLRRY